MAFVINAAGISFSFVCTLAWGGNCLPSSKYVLHVWTKHYSERRCSPCRPTQYMYMTTQIAFFHIWCKRSLTPLRDIYVQCTSYTCQSIAKHIYSCLEFDLCRCKCIPILGWPTGVWEHFSLSDCLISDKLLKYENWTESNSREISYQSHNTSQVHKNSRILSHAREGGDMLCSLWNVPNIFWVGTRLIRDDHENDISFALKNANFGLIFGRI